MKWKTIFIVIGVIVIISLVIVIIIIKNDISINNLLPEFLSAITAFTRQLDTVDVTSPTNDSSNSTGGTFVYTCLLDFGGGAGSGTTGDGNWTYCAGLGCTPDTLLTSGTSDLTGTDADGLLVGCTGNDCGNYQESQTVTGNTAGVYHLRCEGIDQDAPTLKSAIYKFTVTAPPSGCEVTIPGGVYVPKGCTYYIPNGSSAYIT